MLTQGLTQGLTRELTQAQIDEYHERGFIGVEGVLPDEQVAELQAVTDDFVERSREATEHTDVFDLEPDHTPENPKLRRIKEPHLVHDAYDRVMRDEGIVEMTSKLFGTWAVRTHGSKLNMKSGEFGSPVHWHQDWAFYPHTNDDVLAVGVAIDDMTRENGCLLAIPGSHRGPILDHNQDGAFVGAVTEHAFDPADAEPIEVRAGGISIHHVRTLHGSMPNTSEAPRRLLLLMYCAGDAYPIWIAGGQMDWDQYRATFVRGEASNEVRMASAPVRLPQPPPIRSGSIYETQRELREAPSRLATSSTASVAESNR